jgi:O-antigen ligase
MGSGEVIAAPRYAIIAGSFLVCAIVLGGGGSPNPGTEVVLQLIFVAAALAWLWIPARGAPAPVPRAKGFWLVCCAVVALPLVQLVPLPPSIWTSLAGQEDRAAALALVGREHSWQPLTHSAPRTLAALLAIVPALFAFFATASLDVRSRTWLAGTIAAMTLAAALFGALQVSLGPASAPYLYSHNSLVLTGFQANHNAAADMLLIGIAASAAFLMPSLAPQGGGKRLFAHRRAAWLVLGGVVAVLFFAVLLTTSRTGIALLPLVLAGVSVMFLQANTDRGRRWFVPLIALLAAIPVVAIFALESGNTALGHVAERFFFSDDPRRELWRDGWFAMSHAWPHGVGMGGAQPALIAAERLEVLDPFVPNRVHNDYLELLLEGGVLAMVLFVVVAGALVWAAWRSWWERPDARHLTVLGVVVMLVGALHSFVDYPLRSMALACVMGTGAGLLMSTPRKLAANEPSA